MRNSPEFSLKVLLFFWWNRPYLSCVKLTKCKKEVTTGKLYWINQEQKYLQWEFISVHISSTYITKLVFSLTENNLPYNWQYKDVSRKTIENQHLASILDAKYYLSVYNVHFKLASSTE